MPKADKVIDGEPHPLGVGHADDVHRGAARALAEHDDRQPLAEHGQTRLADDGADENGGRATVIEQGVDRPA